MQEKHIFLVRHGESESNIDTIARGNASKLSERGQTQASIVSERIANLNIDALISSPFVRAMQTAHAIENRIGKQIEVCELFVERRSSSQRLGKALDDSGVRELEQQIFDGYAIPGYRHSDEETHEDLRARAIAALEYLCSRPEERICVVTHGIFLRILACTVIHGKNFTGKEMQDCIHHLETENTGLFYLHYAHNDWEKVNGDSMEWRMRSWNDLAHLG